MQSIPKKKRMRNRKRDRKPDKKPSQIGFEAKKLERSPTIPDEIEKETKPKGESANGAAQAWQTQAKAQTGPHGLAGSRRN